MPRSSASGNKAWLLHLRFWEWVVSRGPKVAGQIWLPLSGSNSGMPLVISGFTFLWAAEQESPLHHGVAQGKLVSVKWCLITPLP